MRKAVERYRVAVVDPPWHFNDKLPGKKRGAAKHYRTMKLPELLRFPLPPMQEASVLFLWRVSSMQREALELATAWGFEPKTEIVWVKTKPSTEREVFPTLSESSLVFGMGRITRGAHETCLVATRGRPEVRFKNERSVIFAPRGRHSEKPVRFYDLVERLYAGPYVDVFARAPREGWATYGDEL